MINAAKREGIMGAGHRKRTVARVVQAHKTYPHDLLEVLLFNVCPRKDMNACATALLDRFDSVVGVLTATEEELMQVKGVGENIAQYLIVIGMSLTRIHGTKSFGFSRSTSEFRRLPILNNRVREEDSLEFYVLDDDGRVRMIMSVEKNERKKDGLIKRLVPARAHGVFVLRCNGGVVGTEEEEELCKTVHEACILSGVKMYDYCIDTPQELYSFYVNGKISGDRI